MQRIRVSCGCSWKPQRTVGSPPDLLFAASSEVLSSLKSNVSVSTSDHPPATSSSNDEWPWLPGAIVRSLYAISEGTLSDVLLLPPGHLLQISFELSRTLRRSDSRLDHMDLVCCRWLRAVRLGNPEHDHQQMCIEHGCGT